MCTADQVRHIINTHGPGKEDAPGQRPVTEADIKAVPSLLDKPGRWRKSTDQEKKGWSGDAATFEADTGERLAFRITTGSNDPRLTLHTMWAKEKSPPEP